MPAADVIKWSPVVRPLGDLTEANVNPPLEKMRKSLLNSNHTTSEGARHHLGEPGVKKKKRAEKNLSAFRY